MTLTAIGLLAPHLTAENHMVVLDSARHRSKREVERIVAELRPLPPVLSTIRKLPASTPASPTSARPTATDAARYSDGPTTPTSVSSAAASSALPVLAVAPVRPAVVTPLAPTRYKVQITVSAETVDKLRRAQDLLRHCVPDGDPAAIVDRALSLLVAQLERTKLAATAAPRGGRPTKVRSRHIPAAVRRAVWARDEGRCAFVSRDGRRCTERGFLEFHHVVPYAAGGEATVAGISLRCRAHNVYEADQEFSLPWADDGDRWHHAQTTRSGPS